MIAFKIVLEALMSQSRRNFLLGATAAVGTVGFDRQASSQNMTKVRVGTIPIVDSAPLMIGIAKGFFRDEGLDINTTPAPGGAAILPSLAAGQFQFAFSNTTSTLLAIGEGLEFKFVTAGCSTGPKGPDLAGLMARADSGIKSGKDLVGKRLAVNNRNNIMWIRAASWVDKTGGNAERVTFVEIPFPQMVDALMNGQVDAAMVNEPFLSVGKQNQGQKIEVVSWPMSDTAPNGVVSQYVATKDFIAQNPAVVEKFAKGFAHGTDWVLKNQGTPQWEQAVSAYTKIAPERLRGIALPIYDRVVEPQKIQDMIDLMRKYKILKADLKVSDLIHPTALKQYTF
jgi:NitT/TauT family transport system substrate-binding protein